MLWCGCLHRIVTTAILISRRVKSRYAKLGKVPLCDVNVLRVDHDRSSVHLYFAFVFPLIKDYGPIDFKVSLVLPCHHVPVPSIEERMCFFTSRKPIH